MALLEALSAKLTAMLDMEEISNGQKQGQRKSQNGEGDEIDQVYNEFVKLDTKRDYAILHSRHEAREGR